MSTLRMRMHGCALCVYVDLWVELVDGLMPRLYGHDGIAALWIVLYAWRWYVYYASAFGTPCARIPEAYVLDGGNTIHFAPALILRTIHTHMWR